MAENQEASIAKAKRLSIDEIMADDFDPESMLSSENRTSYIKASEIVGKDELDSTLKLNTFFQQTGSDNDSKINGNIQGLSALTNQTTRKGLWGSISEGWKNNSLQMDIADIRLAEMNGRISPEIAQKQIDYLKQKMRQTEPSNVFASFGKSAANIVPMMLETTESGLLYGGTSAVAAAGTALLAGQAGPQAALPEEAVTVPGAAVTFGVLGYKVGSGKRATELEAGLMYDELMDMKDANGNKISRDIAVPVASALGGLNGLLEMAQISTLIKTIPGGKKLLAKAQQKTMKSLIASKSIQKVLLGASARYGGNIATETGIEVAQEADNIIFGELAKNVSNELQKTGFSPASIKDITGRIVDTAKESAKGFAVLAAPGNVIQTAKEVKAASPATPVTAKQGLGIPQGGAKAETVPQPTNRISRITTGESIKTRVDVSSLGKTMVDEPVELPTKQPREKAEKEPVITPEEEYQLLQTESTMAATEEIPVKPNLYIGNVTARMKEVMGEQFGVDPEAIHGFTEGAFPTKRTRIEMSTGDARSILVHLENSLQDRVDNNKLNTDSDLARANADWGDIKELRRILGLPKTVRPFRVIREKGTRTVLIENTRERIKKTTESGALDTIQTTEIKRLDEVLRRSAKYARDAYQAGGKAAREAYQLRQYIKKLKQMRESLINRITANPSKNVDFFYREAIKGLQNSIDWEATTIDKQEKKATRAELIKEKPELEQEMSPEIIDTLDKKNVSDLSYTDLITLNDEINRLRKLGKLKSSLYRKQRKDALQKEAKAMSDDISKAATAVFSTERANTLKPSRIFDMLDGGKNFAGRIYNFFYGQTNEDYDRELQNSDARLKSGKQRREELGISLKDLQNTRVIQDIKFTLDEMLSIYAGWMNTASQAKMRYGGLKINSQTKAVEITDAIYNDVVENLTNNEKIWADTIINEYAQNSYDRLRNAVISAENRDMGREINYTPMLMADRDYVSTEQELLDELSYRHFISRIGPAKSMTIKRKNIPPKHQKPIKSGLTKIWMQQVRKQEHYINNALHIKDMQAILNDEGFRNSIKERFGDSMLNTVKDFVSRIANPDYYKSYNDIENLSKVLRRNAAVAYIALNLSSVLNQTTGLFTYWSNSSVMDIISSCIQTALHPMKSYERAVGIHYQLSHNSIEREMMELERADSSLYKKIMNTVGTAGMYGIFAMDRVIRIIGINAVYDKAIRDGLSVQEAKVKAQQTTLLTQEAASAKDLAKIYATNETLNWFLMFTNQLNQIWNITTYDIPVMVRNKQYINAARSTMALSLMAASIWMIQNRELPEEPEDFASIFSDQFLGSIPLIGSWINSAREGWTSQLPVQAAVFKTVKGITKITEGELEEAAMYLFEPLAIATGMPYQAALDAYKFVTDDFDEE